MPLLTQEAEKTVDGYLERLKASLDGVSAAEQEHLVEQARARLDLALELEYVRQDDTVGVRQVLERLEEPAALAQRLRAQSPVRVEETPLGRLTACRSCRREVSVEAQTCPHCGAPFPARFTWRGPGYEWKSKQTLFGLPVVHIAFGRDQNGKVRVAKGVIAIGQVAVGAITIAQFGFGALFGLGQFVVAPLAVGQLAIGLVAIGQFGIGALFGLGQIATGIKAIGQVAVGNWFR